MQILGDKRMVIQSINNICYISVSLKALELAGFKYILTLN